jgi:hypothetical protein
MRADPLRWDGVPVPSGLTEPVKDRPLLPPAVSARLTPIQQMVLASEILQRRF